MPKPKLNELRLVESTKPGYDRVVTVASREVHNHYELYRVKEIPGALYSASSLHRILGKDDKPVTVFAPERLKKKALRD